MKELLIYALEVLVCSAALLLAYSVLLERRTAFLHCRLYLIGAMLLAALIPALSIPVWTGETLYMAADPVAAAAPTAAPAATDAGTPSLPVAVTLFLYALGVLLSFGAMIAPATERVEEWDTYFWDWGARAYIFSGSGENTWNPVRTMQVSDDTLYIYADMFRELGG